MLLSVCLKKRESFFILFASAITVARFHSLGRFPWAPGSSAPPSPVKSAATVLLINGQPGSKDPGGEVEHGGSWGAGASTGL